MVSKHIFSELISLFLGGWDGMIYTLTVFMVVDIITTLLVSIVIKGDFGNLNILLLSQKVTEFILVGVGHIIDLYIANGGDAFRRLIILFYIAYEGRIISNNAVKLKLPVPRKLKDFLSYIFSRCDDTNKKKEQ